MVFWAKSEVAASEIVGGRPKPKCVCKVSGMPETCHQKIFLRSIELMSKNSSFPS